MIPLSSDDCERRERIRRNNSVKYSGKIQSISYAALTLWVLLISGCKPSTDEKQEARSMSDPTSGSVQHINPEGLHKNPAYSQAVVVSGAAKTVYVGGQNAVDASGAVVGKGDMKTQGGASH
jgi:enamine deaminase RidA (YjgF/YER057c/UK114 family)